MKKVIFALAAVVALAACSQEDVIVADKGAAIGFDTFVENSTRSVYDPSYTNSSMFSDFAVYGYVNGAVLLDGVRVAKNGADMDADDYAGQAKTEWKYAGTQYWIAGANYNFNAVAPKTGGNWTVVKKDADKNVVTNASQTTLSFTNNGTTDLLYAYATAVGANKNNEVVGFNFRHVLSKVKFSFENAYNATNATIRVENVKIHDAYASGSVVLNDKTAWTPAENSNTLALEFGNAAVGSATAEEPFANGKTVESYKELLMIPGQGASTHTVTNADATTTEYKNVYKVTFNVVLLVSGQEIDTYEHTIYTTFAPEAGMRYNLKAVIKPENIDPEHSQEPILFTVNEINDWDNGNTKDSDDTDTENDYYPLN